MARRTTLTIALLALLPTALALDPLDVQDDAGTSADAPDDAAEALLLAPGPYLGSLDGLLDVEDWYEVAVADDEVFRVDLRATSGRVWLRVETLEGSQVHQDLASGRDIRYVGVDGRSYRFQIATDVPAPGGATYAFAVTLLRTIPQRDGGVPGDASGIVAHARPLDPGTYRGELYPPSFDLNDRYRIAKPWGGWVNVTMTPDEGKTLTLYLESVCCIDAAWRTTGEPATFSTWYDVEIIRVNADEDGEHAGYTLSFEWYWP